MRFHIASITNLTVISVITLREKIVGLFIACLATLHFSQQVFISTFSCFQYVLVNFVSLWPSCQNLKDFVLPDTKSLNYWVR